MGEGDLRSRDGAAVVSLSKRELDLTRVLAECWNEYTAILKEDGPNYYSKHPEASDSAKVNDLREFAAAIHICQRQVMAVQR